jgi:hypothetical protein
VRFVGISAAPSAGRPAHALNRLIREAQPLQGAADECAAVELVAQRGMRFDARRRHHNLTVPIDLRANRGDAIGAPARLRQEFHSAAVRNEELGLDAIPEGAAGFA